MAVKMLIALIQFLIIKEIDYNLIKDMVLKEKYWTSFLFSVINSQRKQIFRVVLIYLTY